MAANIGKTIACFKELGIHPKLSSFKDKLVMQKTIYLLKRMGLDTGFDFGLYVRGPYSPGLTKALYENKQEVEELSTASKLSQNELEKISELMQVVDFGKPALLEITATYACLKYEKNYGEEEATRRLKELKPFYSEAQIAVGISKAKQLFFKPTEEDLRMLREELAPWQKAAEEDMARIEW